MALIEEITYESVLKDMLAAYEAETGFVPDEASDISIRLRVLASQIHSAAETGKWLLRQMFFSTAEGEFLDRHAELHLQLRQVDGDALAPRLVEQVHAHDQVRRHAAHLQREHERALQARRVAHDDHGVGLAAAHKVARDGLLR